MSDRRKNSFRVKWSIENLTSWLKTRDDSLYSPQFLAETLGNTRWKLRLSRKLHLAEKYISLALERDIEDENPKPIALNYELSFLGCDELSWKSKFCTTKFSPKTVSLELNVKEVEILFEKKVVCLPEGALRVSCKLWNAWSTTSRGGRCLLRSVIGRKCVTLDGNIENYSSMKNSNAVSLNFVSSSLDISFVSCDVRLKNDTLLSFERTNFECKNFNSYSCKLFVLKSEGSSLINVASHMATLLTSHKSCAFELVYQTLNDSRYLRNDTLTFQLEITYNPGVKSEYVEYDDNNDKNLTAEPADMENMNTSISEVNFSPIDSLYLTQPEDECTDTAGKKNLPSTTFKEDMTSLFNDRLFCDTKLQTDTETFPAHRSVLSARSPVFKKMFTTDMKEMAGECIPVPDFSSDTVRRMLQFLYTDYIGDLDMQSAKDLYVASDKYDITSLKQRCSSFMKMNLCPANVCEVIVLADMHQDKDLESTAHEFVLTYDKEVLGSDEWKLFMKNFTTLAAQIMYLKCMKE